MQQLPHFCWFFYKIYHSRILLLSSESCKGLLNLLSAEEEVIINSWRVCWMCLSGVCVRCVCVCAWESRGRAGGWAQQSSPSSGVCQRVTTKAEDRQCRVMRDAAKIGSTVPPPASAEDVAPLTRTHQLIASELLLPVRPGEGGWSGVRPSLVPADD